MAFSSAPALDHICANMSISAIREIDAHAAREEKSAGLRQFHTPLAHQPLVEFVLHRMEIAHVRCGITALRVAQHWPAPVRALLLLADSCPKVLTNSFEGHACQYRCARARSDLGAIDRRAGHAR